MTICSETVYGCCPDGISFASGPDFEGCSETTSKSFNVAISYYVTSPVMVQVIIYIHIKAVRVIIDNIIDFFLTNYRTFIRN